MGDGWDTGGVVPFGNPYVAGHQYYFSVQYLDRYDWGVTVEDLSAPEKPFNMTVHNPAAGGTNYLQPYAYAVSERLLMRDALGHTFLTQYMAHATVSFQTVMVNDNNAGWARFSIESPASIDMYSLGTRIGAVGALDTSTSSFTENQVGCGQVEQLS